MTIQTENTTNEAPATPAAPEAPVVLSTATRVENLVKRRETWQRLVLKTNAMHYGILQEIAILADKTPNAEIEPLLVKYGVKMAKNTSKVLVFTKFVFGANTDEEGKKASANAKAIENALKNVAADEVSNWLTGIGGVENARKWKPAASGNTPSANTPNGTLPANVHAQPAKTDAEKVSSPVIQPQDEKPLERAMEYLRTAHGPLVIGAENFHDLPLPMVGSGYCAVVFAPTSDGNYQPVFATSHTDAVNAALRQMGRTLANPADDENATTSVVIARPNAEVDNAGLDALMNDAIGG